MPKVIQQPPLSIGIHWLPEPVVFKHDQLSVLCESLQRFSFEYEFLIVGDVLPDPPVEHEKAAVDPALFGLRFFPKIANHGDARTAVGSHHPESPRRSDSGHRRDPSVGLVKLYQFTNIDVCDAISISQAE